jgi:glycerol-3-phosphate cytidylyltransferase
MGLKIYTGGTFDLFHSGHVELLRRLKHMAGPGGRVIVSLNTDEFVEKFKGSKPIMSYKERFAVVSACKYVDLVVENYGGPDSKPVILDVKADFVVAGTDWSDKDYMKQMGFTREWLEENNVGFGFLPYTDGVSSTDIKKRIIDRRKDR